MDITKCSGDKCPIKDKCYRYLADESEYQSYVLDPHEIKDGVFTCDLFWGVGAQQQYELIKSITKGEL